MVELEAVNLWLSVAVKVVFLIVFAISLYMLKRLDDLIQAAESSAESIEDTAENIGAIVSFAKMLPFTGRKGDEDE